MNNSSSENDSKSKNSHNLKNKKDNLVQNNIKMY